MAVSIVIRWRDCCVILDVAVAQGRCAFVLAHPDELSRDCALMAIGNYHCQRNSRLHDVSISRTCQVEFRMLGTLRCILLDSCDHLASFWILLTISAIAKSRSDKYNYLENIDPSLCRFRIPALRASTIVSISCELVSAEAQPLRSS